MKQQGKKQSFLSFLSFFVETNRVTHAALSMSCRAGCDSLGSRSERLCTTSANQLPKQQLPADGSVFLIRLLQLWMVHSNQAARHPPASAAYHALAGEEEVERSRREAEEGKATRGNKNSEEKRIEGIQNKGKTRKVKTERRREGKERGAKESRE